MSRDEREREVVFRTFLIGCSEELPENKHIDIDLLRRLTGFSSGKILRLLGSMSSLGLFASLRDEHDGGHLGTSQMVVLEWHHLSKNAGGNATGIADATVLSAVGGLCEEHAIEHLRRLDFSRLSSTCPSGVATQKPPRSPRTRARKFIENALDVKNLDV